MLLLIAGDLTPKEVNIEAFNNADVSALLGEELLSYWYKADMRVFNLETPLCDKSTPILKYGRNFSTPTSTIKGIKALRPTLVTLANNHIFDHGSEGLKSTIALLEKEEIPYVGVGKNIYEASKPYIIHYNNYKIGVYACCEHEFSYAEDDKCGANPFDFCESFDHISKLKENCDYCIVLYHGGKELYQYPSPNLQKICRKMISKGANIVICQHSHCVGCYENYQNGTIVYGQGNFIFNVKNNKELWNTSVIISLNILENKISYLPIVRTEKGVRLANSVESKEILSKFYERSEKILQPGFVVNEYKKFAQKNLDNYLRKVSGMGKVLIKIDKLLSNRILKSKYHKNKKIMLRNILECEAHYELFLTGLKDILP